MNNSIIIRHQGAQSLAQSRLTGCRFGWFWGCIWTMFPIGFMLFEGCPINPVEPATLTSICVFWEGFCSTSPIILWFCCAILNQRSISILDFSFTMICQSGWNANISLILIIIMKCRVFKISIPMDIKPKISSIKKPIQESNTKSLYQHCKNQMIV